MDITLKIYAKKRVYCKIHIFYCRRIIFCSSSEWSLLSNRQRIPSLSAFIIVFAAFDATVRYKELICKRALHFEEVYLETCFCLLSFAFVIGILSIDEFDLRLFYLPILRRLMSDSLFLEVFSLREHTEILEN